MSLRSRKSASSTSSSDNADHKMLAFEDSKATVMEHGVSDAPSAGQYGTIATGETNLEVIAGRFDDFSERTHAFAAALNVFLGIIGRMSGTARLGVVVQWIKDDIAKLRGSYEMLIEKVYPGIELEQHRPAMFGQHQTQVVHHASPAQFFVESTLLRQHLAMLMAELQHLKLHDEELFTALVNFSNALRYTDEHAAFVKYPWIQKFRHTTQRTAAKKLPRFSTHLRNITTYFSRFNEKVNEIDRAAQSASVSHNEQISQISTFLATLISLIITYDAPSDTAIGVATQTLWFFALVCSILAMLNSLVDVVLTKANYRPFISEKVNPIMFGIFEHGPLALLAAAGLGLLLGLCTFTFSVHKSLVVSLFTAIPTGIFILSTLLLFTFLTLKRLHFWWKRKRVQLFLDSTTFSNPSKVALLKYAYWLPKVERDRIARVILKREMLRKDFRHGKMHRFGTQLRLDKKPTGSGDVQLLDVKGNGNGHGNGNGNGNGHGSREKGAELV